MGETAAPDGRCTPIVLVLGLFQVVLGGTRVVYEIGPRREFLSGSLSVSSMEQIVGMFCLGRRGGMGILVLFYVHFCVLGSRVCRTEAGLEWA